MTIRCCFDFYKNYYIYIYIYIYTSTHNLISILKEDFTMYLITHFNNHIGTQNGFAETYAPGSRCVKHGSVQWVAGGSTFSPQGAGCYQVRCESKNSNWFDQYFVFFVIQYNCSNGSVILNVLDQAYICTQDGQQVCQNSRIFAHFPIQCYLIFPD